MEGVGGLIGFRLEVGIIGWEYHNRQRGKRGRFAQTGRTEQLHVWCTPLQYSLIRGRAGARQMSISEYVTDLVRRDLERRDASEEFTVDG